MIYGIYGEAGTGKSALAVSYALDTLEKYDYIFTNIYDFGKNNSVADIALYKNTDINIVLFENSKQAFVDTLRQIEVLFNENNNLSFLILYDECHKSFRSFTKTNDDDIYISDFLSEHRHFHCDMYVMTQGYKKIDYKYKEDFSGWYSSIDLQFKNNISDLEFKTMDKENKTKINIFTLKKSKTWLGASSKEYLVFDCYSSGDNGEKRVKTRMTLLSKRKLIFKILLVFSIITLIYAFYSVSGMLSSKKVIVKNNNFTSSHVVNSVDKNNLHPLFSDKFQKLSDNFQNTEILSKYKILNCLFDSRLLVYYFDNFTLNQKNFNSLSSYYLFTVLSIHKLSNRFIKIQFLVPKNLYSQFSVNFKNSKKLL